MAFRRLWRGGKPAESSPEPASDPGDRLPALRESLRSIIRRTNAHAGQLPTAVIPQIRRIEDLLRELLDHASRPGAGQASVQEMIALDATITDYLPTSLDTFLSLPREFTASHVNADGQSPGDELLEQLMLLERGVRDLAQAVYAGDVERLNAQGRFLHTKFSKSDLVL